jgi:hypothetical protein
MGETNRESSELTENALVKRSALGGTRTPNLLIRSQMLYPLSYERSHSSIPCLEGWLRSGSEHTHALIPAALLVRVRHEADELRDRPPEPLKDPHDPRKPDPGPASEPGKHPRGEPTAKLIGDATPAKPSRHPSVVHRQVDSPRVQHRATRVIARQRVLWRIRQPWHETLRGTAKPAQRLEHDRVLNRPALRHAFERRSGDPAVGAARRPVGHPDGEFLPAQAQLRAPGVKRLRERRQVEVPQRLSRRCC